MGGTGSGRRGAPCAIKHLQGNLGHRPINENEPKIEPGEPVMSPLSEVAAREWRAIVPLLLGANVLTPADGNALAAYCTCYARAEKCRQEIDRNGTITKRAERLMRIEDKALKLMKSYLIEFGLTPASRSRIKVSNDQPQDKLGDFLNRKPTSEVAQ
jgi:P27 family predicted phage terminase small subunit